MAFGSAVFHRTGEPSIQRIEDALRLIERCAPLHYRRIKNNLARIWVHLVPHGAGCYLHSLNACLLDERIVTSETTTVEWIASAIVHEATHARLEKLGIRYDEALRQRIERICARRELDFARHLSGVDALQERSRGGSTGAVKRIRPIPTKTCGRILFRATRRYSVIWERQNGS